MSAQSFNKAQINRGNLTMGHVTTLVRLWQERAGLEVDGFAGTETIRSLNGETEAAIDPLSIPRVWPLAELSTPTSDGKGFTRTSRITSGHSTENPDRPRHHGCDLFYPYVEAHDPPVKVGDGGAAGDRQGRPKWWIPDGTAALASAAGRVHVAGDSPTGHRVWIEHAPGVFTGYFHLSELAIEAGQDVAAGAMIGIVGDNPQDRDARHLHFELYLGDLALYPAGSVNPRAWLEGASQV